MAAGKITAKNGKRRATGSIATPAKKTTAKRTTKQAMSKKTSHTKIMTKMRKVNATDVPAFFPEMRGYRMSDVVSTIEWREDYSPEWREKPDDTLEEYTHRVFPSSIASQYLKKTKRINHMNVLSDLVDEFVLSRSIRIPSEDSMVMHLRVGDVIDKTALPAQDFLDRRVNSYYELFKIQPSTTGHTFSPVYVRCLASFDRALKKTKELGFDKITLVYGFHIKTSIDKSKEYIAGLVQYAHSQGFKVEIMTHADADVCFAYACQAKHFIPGGGGFSKLISGVVKHKGNDVYYVRV
jgi:hypothetical protein